jgi:hypothetical protein
MERTREAPSPLTRKELSAQIAVIMKHENVRSYYYYYFLIIIILIILINLIIIVLFLLSFYYCCCYSCRWFIPLPHPQPLSFYPKLQLAERFLCLAHDAVVADSVGDFRDAFLGDFDPRFLDLCHNKHTYAAGGLGLID